MDGDGGIVCGPVEKAMDSRAKLLFLHELREVCIKTHAGS